MDQKKELYEIRLIEIKPEKLLNHTAHRKLFHWALKKIFLFRFASFLLIADLCIPLLFMCVDIYFKIPIKIAIRHIPLSILPASLLLFIHTISPKISYAIGFRASKRKYGESYNISLMEDGIHLHAKKYVLIPWKKHRIIEGKYGIAIISFYRIIALIMKDDFLPEQYEQIRRWCSLQRE